MAERKPTRTSPFGVSRRESHDASGFYARFTLPAVSNDEHVEVNPDDVLDRVYVGDSRAMPQLVDGSVALVVTSPPYFAGKEYEQALGEGHVPASYLDYLDMLHEVFTECVRVLEPGGRIAVNVANLGRRPYRSLASDVIRILQDRLGLLLRGEIIWVKGQGASGSCAWGSFQSPANPVLRDLSERIVIASKGRFDRALARSVRAERGLPSEPSMTRDDFLELTTDVWEFPTESAQRVGHPAPFPVELPRRLIELYTYRGDVVLDPFAGSGSTAIAALQADRRFVAYDVDPDYVRRAEERIARERARLAQRRRDRAVEARSVRAAPVAGADPIRTALDSGRRAHEIALELLAAAGFEVVERGRRLPGGAELSFAARDERGGSWLFEVTGGFTTFRPGLNRPEALSRALAKAALVKGAYPDEPLVLLSPGLPPSGSAGDQALSAVRGVVVHDVVDLLEQGALARLRALAVGARDDR
jgi:site-specific DNA-methyltransferase (adenine-specific)